jgi:hypothetical protein
LPSYSFLFLELICILYRFTTPVLVCASTWREAYKDMFVYPLLEPTCLVTIVPLNSYSVLGCMLFARGFNLDPNYGMPQVNFDSFPQAMLTMFHMMVFPPPSSRSCNAPLSYVAHAVTPMLMLLPPHLANVPVALCWCKGG